MSRLVRLSSVSSIALALIALSGVSGRAQSPASGELLRVPWVQFVDGVQNAPVAGAVHASSADSAKAMVFVVTRQPAHGHASFADAAKEQWVYTPEPGFVGNDEFRIGVTAHGLTKEQRVVVMVNYAATRRTLYVDAVHGSDKNPGTEKRPFASIQAASDVTRPGDTVLIEDGTYNQTSPEGVVTIARSGAPGAMITYRAYPGAHPKLFAKDAWNHILITASYIRVEGLEIAGNAQNVSIDDAAKVEARFESGHGLSFGPETSFAETNGISIRPANQKAPLRERIYPRRIEIVGNNIHDVQGGGISAQWSDLVTIAGNRIHDVAIRAMYACSGISILGAQTTDAATPAYRMVVENNLVVGARTYVKWVSVKHMSDGNGIILDSNRNAQDKGEPFTGRFLVANNVVMASGGAGIQVFSTDNADVVFNTVYDNSLTPELEYGQIWAHAASNLRVENNILVAGHDAKINEAFKDNNNVIYDYNIYFGGRKPGMMGPHDIVGDPEFVNPKDGNLKLQASSPAVDSGVTGFPVARDFDGNPRVSGKGPDRGAFELQGNTRKSESAAR